MRFLYSFFITLSILSSTFPIAHENQSYYSVTKSADSSYIIDHPYGLFTITEPVLIELLEHPMMERVKHVHQYGFDYPFFTPYEYSRFDHCLGVFLLLRRFNCSLKEQIAGLLHDASHTAGSHVAEMVFNHRSLESSYQDDIHAWYLHQWDIETLLTPYGLTVDDVLAKNPVFRGLNQPNGELCADRLDYNLIGGLKEGMLTTDQIDSILNNLRFEDNNWYFNDQHLAQLFAVIPLYHTEYLWGSAVGQTIYHWVAHALQRALEIDLITFDDIHFGTDKAIWDILSQCDDQLIKHDIDRLSHYKNHFYISNESHYDIHIYGKFRGINPWVKTDQGLQRLKDLDASFASFYNTIKNRMLQGWYIAFVD